MPEKLDRCVNDVKGQKGVDNAYAICNASLNEAQKFPYPFPAINSKDATKERIEPYDAEQEAVAIGGGLSSQSVGGKVIEPDKEFDKLHEALEGEAREPVDRLEMEGADPSVTLDPEPSPTEHRDPSQTLDPATEQYDYGNYGTDEGGPGSGPQGGTQRSPQKNTDMLADIALDQAKHNDPATAVQNIMNDENVSSGYFNSDDFFGLGQEFIQAGDQQTGNILMTVGSNLKSTEGGGEAMQETICSCNEFDKINEALKDESKS